MVRAWRVKIGSVYRLRSRRRTIDVLRRPSPVCELCWGDNGRSKSSRGECGSGDSICADTISIDWCSILSIWVLEGVPCILIWLLSLNWTSHRSLLARHCRGRLLQLMSVLRCAENQGAEE